MAINRLIQGSLQSGLPKFDSVWDGRSAVGSMEPISSVTLTGNQTSVEFNNIPQTYSHLQIRGIIRSAAAQTGEGYLLRMNNNTTVTYAYHISIGSGSAASAVGDNSQTYINNGDIAGANCGANTFGAIVIDIVDYSDTTKFKTSRTIAGFDNNGSGSIRQITAAYRSTTAVTSLQFSSNTVGANFVANSSFSLYGIK